MPVFGIRVVLRFIIGKADKEIVAGCPLGAESICEDIFVIMLGASVEIFAKAITRVFGNRAANRELVTQWC